MRTREARSPQKAFSLFDARTKSRDVVIDLRQTPEKILTLHAQWRRMGREMLLREEDRNATCERFGAPSRSPRDLIGLLVRDLARLGGDSTEEPAAAAE